MFGLSWVGTYLCIALLVTAGVVAFAGKSRTEDPSYRPVRESTALLIGALWPVLLVGAAQLLLIHVAAKRARDRAVPVAPLATPPQWAPGSRATDPWKLSA
jgi:hypothetical protein